MAYSAKAWKGFATIGLAAALGVWLGLPLVNKYILKKAAPAAGA